MSRIPRDEDFSDFLKIFVFFLQKAPGAVMVSIIIGASRFVTAELKAIRYMFFFYVQIIRPYC